MSVSGNDEATTIKGIDGKDVAVKRADVLHLLEQELRRLQAWQRTEPKFQATGDIGNDVHLFKNAVEKEAATNSRIDVEWGVRIVAIPSTNGSAPLFVTYGELNSLADFYGSVDELKAANPVKRHNVIQAVRAQSYEELLKIYRALAKRPENKQRAKQLAQGDSIHSSNTAMGAKDAVHGGLKKVTLDEDVHAGEAF